jgi:hypothetical protein
LLLGYSYAAVCAPAMILSAIFFHYWIGVDFALVAALMAQIFLFGAWTNGLAFTTLTVLQSREPA